MLGAGERLRRSRILRSRCFQRRARVAHRSARGRYVLQNDEHVDVLIARKVSTVDGILVAFDDVWARREYAEVAPGVKLAVPSIDDLILTKRFGGRTRDAEDIAMIEQWRKTRK